MHLKTAAIGDTFDPEYFDKINYFSDDYFLDCDILIIDLKKVREEIDNLCVGRNMKSPGWLPEDTLNEIKAKLKDRQAQLTQYFNGGGNLFIQIPFKTIESYFTEGAVDNFGPIEIDLLYAVGLSSEDFSKELRRGNNIAFTDSIFTDFFQQLDCSYEFSYSKFKGAVTAKINRTSQPISVIISKARGNILFLPEVKISAGDYDDFQYRNSIVLKAFQKLDQDLKTRYKPQPDILVPEWCAAIYLSNEQAQLKKMNMLFEERDNVLQKIEEQQRYLTRYANLKELLFESGNNLENRVKHIFVEFGYEILDAEERRDDLVIQYKNDVGVIEIKGVKGSAAESNASQLMKWVSTYHHDKGQLPKGILIVNPFKDKPFVERTEQAFPSQMLPFCEKMELALITTTQLLGLYLDFKNNELTLKKIHHILWSTIGKLDFVPTKIS